MLVGPLDPAIISVVVSGLGLTLDQKSPEFVKSAVRSAVRCCPLKSDSGGRRSRQIARSVEGKPDRTSGSSPFSASLESVFTSKA